MEKQKDNKQRNVLTEDNASKEELSAFERWELPAMDDGLSEDATSNPFSTVATRPTSPGSQAATSKEPDPEEEVITPLTAEDLEAIRQAAYEEGKDQGQQEGYKAGYDQGFKSGESDVKASVTKLAQISRALLEPIPQQDDELENALLELVENICQRVVQRELKLDSDSVLHIIKEALGCLNTGAKRVRIHLNPDDAEFVKNALEDSGDLDETWRILPHPTISPGGCIVDTDNTVIDMRAEKRLATVIKQVYDQDQSVLEQEQQKQGGLDQLMGEVDAFVEDDIEDDGES